MESVETGALLILGIGVFGGIVGASVFQRLRVPQVVGYIVMGLLIGDVGLGLVSHEAILRLESLNLFALGIIGFLVGGELLVDTFREKGKQLVSILLFEGISAFVLVGIASAAIFYLIVGDFTAALAAGVVFGAIASATDPASTLNVFWEYRSRGILTTAVIAIVALDDALAMTLYGVGSTTARILTGDSPSISQEALRTGLELLGAVALGCVSGIFLRYLTHWLKRPDRGFGAAVGGILLIIGIAAALDMDVILAAMTLGVTLRNIAPRRSKEIFETVRSFADPIYVIFFVLVGARLEIAAMPAWLWAVAGLYIVGRSIGKIGGAYLGGRITGAPAVVSNYAGLGLFAQGGIAVGLSIMAAHHLRGIELMEGLFLSDAIVFVVTTSTVALQLIGPSLIKKASQLAGEFGCDVTNEDVIESWKVADAMRADIVPIEERTALTDVFRIFTENDHLVYPVVDKHGRLSGVISLDELKDVMTNQDTWPWVLAVDVMVPATDRVTAETPLQHALDMMRDYDLEELPVVNNDDELRAVGILDERGVRIRLSEEVVRRRQAA